MFILSLKEKINGLRS